MQNPPIGSGRPETRVLWAPLIDRDSRPSPASHSRLTSFCLFRQTSLVQAKCRDRRFTRESASNVLRVVDHPPGEAIGGCTSASRYRCQHRNF
jgi:hypothetical protein